MRGVGSFVRRKQNVWCEVTDRCMTETERLMGGGAPCNRSVSSRPPLSFLHTSAPIAPIPCPIITHLLLCFLHTTNPVPCIFLSQHLRYPAPFSPYKYSISFHPSLRLPRTSNPLTPIRRCDTIVQTICIHPSSASTAPILRLGSIYPSLRFLRMNARLSPHPMLR